MLGKRQTLKIGMMGVAMTLLATPAFARSVELKGAGATLWIFLIIGTIIVLLQLIPAAVLFFSFVGTTTAALKEEKRVGQAILSEIEPIAVKK
jgi:membrane associated rhomboid family serine protease